MRSYHDTIRWTNKLLERGYGEYEYSKLPDDLRDKGKHLRAIEDGLVRKVKRVHYHGVYKWRVTLN